MSGEPPTLPTYEELSEVPKEELIRRMNSYLKESEKATDAAFYPLRAEIFMQELGRREQNEQTKIMLSYTNTMKNCTWCIGVMTFIILVATIWPPRHATDHVEVGAQNSRPAN